MQSKIKQNIILGIFFSVVFLLLSSAHASASTYYVATNGSDGYTGLAATYTSGTTGPFLHVQTALNVVRPGDTVDIEAGVYNESLSLSTSGTSSFPITVQSYNGATVTINSGTAITLMTNGAVSYYIFSSLRFLATFNGTPASPTSYAATGKDYSLDFEHGSWGGEIDPTQGNNGFIINNCYIQGAVHFYGHNNTVSNSELNGLSDWDQGIMEFYAPSHDNLYIGNKIHDYTTRGVWSMQLTTNVQIMNNTIYNIGNMGIDLDGAANNEHNGIVSGNNIYSFTQQGIMLEDAFGALIYSNTVHDPNASGEGTGIAIMNYGTSYADAEYRNTNTNNIIYNNLIENCKLAGIGITESWGNILYNNTIYNTTSPAGYFGAIALHNTGSGSTFYDNNTVMKNNIVYGYHTYGVYIAEPTANGLAGLVSSNNIYYDPSNTNAYYSEAGGTKTLSAYQSSSGKETSSLFTNPLFVSLSNFYLQSTSPAINAGANLASAGVTEDINGTARPQGSGFDIGAYEYISSSGCTPLTFNSGSASPTQVAVNVTYNISCNYGITAVDSVEASNDLGSCTWLNWNGNTANFSCNAGSIGTRTNTCMVAAGTTANSCAQQNSINSVSVISSVNSIPPAAPSGLSLQ